MDKILSKDTIKNVFSALGAKTSDSNYGVALLDKTSGEPKGFMGMSDLASVLGAVNNSYHDAVNDLNSIPATTRMDTFVNVEVDNRPSGVPKYGGCLTIGNKVPSFGNPTIQIWSEVANNAFWIRKCWSSGSNYNWNNWVRLDNFGCSTPADLASLLGGTIRPIEAVSDFNELKTTSGSYIMYNESALNAPSGCGAGILCVYLSIAGDGCIQQFIGTTGIATRNYNFQAINQWSSWKKVTLT